MIRQFNQYKDAGLVLNVPALLVYQECGFVINNLPVYIWIYELAGPTFTVLV